MVSQGSKVRFEMERGQVPGEKTAVVTGEVIRRDGDYVDVEIHEFDSEHEMSEPDSVEDGVVRTVSVSHVNEM